MTKAIPFAVVLMAAAALASPAPLRKTIVLAAGETTVYSTASTIATVSTPPGGNAFVTFTPEQYGNSISIKAVKAGETKLMVESTQSRITEVVRVIVADKAVAARHHFVSSALAGLEGLQQNDITVAGDSVIVAGTLFSSQDLERCRALDTSAAKKGPFTLCEARMSNAVPAVLKELPYQPAANVAFSETPTPAVGAAVEGTEADSNWTALVRIADVPVLELTGRDRASVFRRAAMFASKLNRVAAEWKAATEKGVPYPVTFGAKGTATGYDITAQWKFTQGTRGETLLQLTPDDLVAATARSGGGVERLIQWSTALMQDAFRMYYMAALPMRSVAGTTAVLKKVYEEAIALHGSQLDRTNAGGAIARAVAARRWSTGHDPFDGILTSIPIDFQPAPIPR